MFSLFDDVLSPNFDEGPLVLYLNGLPRKRRRPVSHTAPALKRRLNEPLKIALHIGNFKPEEIKVSLADRTLTVEGSHSSSTDGGSFSSSFKKCINLDEQIDPATVYSKITADGMLEIGAKPRNPARQIEIAVEKASDLPMEGENRASSAHGSSFENIGPDMDTD